jgi:hypothetical protein
MVYFKSNAILHIDGFKDIVYLSYRKKTPLDCFSSLWFFFLFFFFIKNIEYFIHLSCDQRI